MIDKTSHQTQSVLLSVIYPILFLCLLLLANTVNGTSVLSVDLEEMLNNCDFVFEGRVINIESRMTQNGSSIHTYVVFDIIEIIKGEYPDDEIELSFVGGTVNGMTLKVGDMHIPEVGEKGVYFVESLSRTQVHPFYGWSQGHLLIIKDAAGIERVTTQRKQAVMMVEPAIKRRQPQLSTGAAQGLVVEEGRDSLESMSKTQFVQKLRDMLRPQ
jgi:hypothetical protein